MSQITIAAVIGSIRKDSYNRKLADAVLRMAPADFVVRVVQIDDLPVYNQDDDGAPPPAVSRLKNEIRAASGLIFFTPEHNRSIPTALKNALDHASRPYGQNAWAGKPAGVLGASPGAQGTSMAQQHLRNILAYLDVPTLGQPEVFIQVKEGFFDDKGGIASPETKKFLQGWMDKYAAWVRRFQS